MRISTDRLVLGILIAFAVGLTRLFVFQSVWLMAVQILLKSSATPGIPVAPTFSGGLATPTAPAAVGLTVTRLLRPANRVVGNTAGSSTLEGDEEHLLVDITGRCLTAGMACRLSDFDFAVYGRSGRDFLPSFPGGSPALQVSLKAARFPWRSPSKACSSLSSKRPGAG